MKLKTLLFESTISGINKQIYQGFIKMGKESVAEKFLADLNKYDIVYEKVKKIWKSINSRNYNLSTTGGFSELINAYFTKFDNNFPGIFTVKQISRAIKSDKMKDAFDSWSYLTMLILKKKDKNNLFIQYSNLKKNQINKWMKQI